MSEKKPTKRDWQVVQRQRRFRDFYLETGNALESARAAGYSEATAMRYSPRMAAACEETLRDQCELIGITKLLLVRTLKSLLQAKEPKWNAKAERWDYFVNVTARLAAYDRLKAIIEPEVPKAKNLGVKVGVATDKQASDPRAWMEQYQGEMQAVGGGTLKIGVAVQLEPAKPAGNGNGNGHNGNSGGPAVDSPGRPPEGGD